MHADELDAIGWQRRVDKIEELIRDGHPTEAVTRVSSAFEQLLKVLYGRMAVKLPPKTVGEVVDTLNKRPVDELGLGALCGLYRKCKLFEYVEGSHAAELVRILKTDVPELAKIRNEGVHGTTEASQTEAQLVLLQLKRALEYAGLIPPARSADARPAVRPAAPVAPERQVAPQGRDKVSPAKTGRRPFSWRSPVAVFLSVALGGIVVVIIVVLGAVGAARARAEWAKANAALDDRPASPTKMPGVAVALSIPQGAFAAGDRPARDQGGATQREGSPLGSGDVTKKCAALAIQLNQGRLLSSADEAFRQKNCGGH